MSKIDTIRDLIEAWPSRAQLADDVGASLDSVHKWATRQVIPRHYQALVLSAAAARDIPITAERLVEINARRGAAA